MSTSDTEAPDYSGRVIAGRIRLNECIGGGGMGWVYSAHHLTLDKPIAVKVLRRTRDPAHAARFVREARSTSRLDHPNIVSILDFGEDGDDRLLYLAMEEIVGTTLATVLQRGSLPEAKAVDLMLQVLSALIHAHRAGIVHRDLKPANVMIVQRENDDEQVVDVVKVLDFGLVKLLGEEEEGGALTRKGVTVGTPEYMSPEQCVGGTVDVRTDVYACGAILYEMLCGRPPFQGPDTGQIIMLHLNTRPDPIASLVPGIDPELASVVNWTLEKRANARCPSAVELRRALSRTLSDSDPFDVRTVIDASSFRRVVSESSSLEISEAELLAGAEFVRPPADPSTPPSLEMVSELTRPVDEQEAAGVVIASPTPLDLTEPTSGDDLPFWMWSQAGQRVGPMSYFALARALGGLVADGQADRAYVSADGRTWKSVFEFAQMTEQEGTLSRGPPEALHEVDQDVLSVFARVAIERPTGSIVVESEDDWAEIEIVAGAPTHVRSNDPLLQLPHLLVDRGFPQTRHADARHPRVVASRHVDREGARADRRPRAARARGGPRADLAHVHLGQRERLRGRTA